ncbi:MAG: response regulator transcription factor [Ktedonobacterales bacterium]
MARVLVVDDDRAIRELLRFALECEGHEVTAFRDGLEILTYLRAARAEHPCIILMDIMMPHVDGREVCRQLTLEPRLLGRHTLILMTAALTPGELPPSPAMAYLPKPFNLEQLYALVELLEMAPVAGRETEPDRQTLLAS